MSILPPVPPQFKAALRAVRLRGEARVSRPARRPAPAQSRKKAQPALLEREWHLQPRVVRCCLPAGVLAVLGSHPWALWGAWNVDSRRQPAGRGGLMATAVQVAAL